MPDSSCKLAVTTKHLESYAEVVANPWILVVREVSLVLLLGQDVAKDIKAPFSSLWWLSTLLAVF